MHSNLVFLFLANDKACIRIKAFKQSNFKFSNFDKLMINHA